MKKIIIFLIVFIVIPYLTCVILSLCYDDIRIGQGDNTLKYHLLGKEVQIETNGLYKSMDVEEYVLGVLAGSISADYDDEALKAQAILIRTNVLKEMEEKGTSDATDLSYTYLTVEDRISLFGELNYEKYSKKLERAVADTAGQVIRMEGSLIMALYHEVSIGKTISANEILGEDISYLQSVDSSQDVEAKHYMNIVSYTWEELQALEQAGTSTSVTNMEMSGTSDGATGPETPEVPGEATVPKTPEAPEGATSPEPPEVPDGATVSETPVIPEETASTETPVQKPARMEISVTEQTENGFVKKVSVNGTIYTGEEAMEKYGLASMNFYVEEIEGGIRFVCLGKGNCMGVSQYGANRMALEGKTAEEIIKYYYQGVSLEQYR